METKMKVVSQLNDNKRQVKNVYLSDIGGALWSNN